MAHAHRPTAAARSRPRLLTTLGLTAAFLVVEVLGALFTGSLALLADAGHMLTDVGGLALALFAIWIASRPPTPAKTYGYYRAEILAAATSLNVRGAYLHVLSDALASVGVVAAALVVVATGWTLADPLASVAIALIIAPRTWGLLKQAVNVLLEGTPTHLDLAEIEAAIVRVPGVRRVHDLHVWTLTSGREAMSAHVIVTDVGESDRLLRQLHEVLHARFGIDHTTIQLEMEPTVVLRIQGSNPV